MEAQKNPEQNQDAESIIINNFKFYYRVIAPDLAWHWHKTQHACSLTCE